MEDFIVGDHRPCEPVDVLGLINPRPTVADLPPDHIYDSETEEIHNFPIRRTCDAYFAAFPERHESNYPLWGLLRAEPPFEGSPMARPDLKDGKWPLHAIRGPAGRRTFPIAMVGRPSSLFSVVVATARCRR